MIIAIDGPAGSGKSTIADLLAERFGYSKLDTGAMYRTVAYVSSARGVDLDDEESVVDVARALDIAFDDAGGAPRVLADGADVTREIRTPATDRIVSKVSAYPGVRRALLACQRAFAVGRDVVAEGRDIGTVVFPDAGLKVFLTADPAVRADRRYKELTGKGMSVTMEEVERNIRERDKADMSRAVSPLRQADDAIVLDNSHMSVDEQMAWFMNEFQLKMKN